MNLTCGQEDCDCTATGAFLWPGEKEPALTCSRHMEAARTIAAVMGFMLHEIPLDTAVLILCEKNAKVVEDALNDREEGG